uniref:Uncharacterized protein n=1 Tax=Meloidogyne enterolobii TaxID=390850 RepID=A0A6V7W592_MELEN|nr:unnamed protein product [Meloidogyne enterolobii]
MNITLMNCKGRVRNEGNVYILTQEHQEERHIEGEGKSSSKGGRKRRGQAEATQHGGFDPREIQQAINQSAEEYQRGRGRTSGVIIGGTNI